MFEHLILIGTSYKLGKRVAWHYSDKDISPETFSMVFSKTDKLLGEPTYAVHRLTTESESWESVVKKDSFFENIEVYEELDMFLLSLAEDKEITAMDIAKFLLTLSPMSNLKLQKMIYLVYADYLLKTKKPLFKENILAYSLGPVIKEVYDMYKVRGKSVIEEDADLVKLNEQMTVPLVFAKFMKSDDYLKITDSIKTVMSNYGEKTPAYLVGLTHSDGSPWSRTEINKKIEDDTIIKYHEIERSFI